MRAALLVLVLVLAGAFLAGLALAVALLALRVLAARGLVVLVLVSVVPLALVVLAVLRTLGFLVGVAAGASCAVGAAAGACAWGGVFSPQALKPKTAAAETAASWKNWRFCMVFLAKF